MLGRNHLDKMKEQFSDQFEPDGDGFLYRKSMRGAPVRLTAAERDRFVAGFGRAVRHLSWAFGAGIFIFVLGLVWYVTAFNTEVEDYWLYLGLAILVAAFMLAWFRIWNLPAAELERRTPVGPERTRSQVRQVMLSKTGWGEIAAMAVLMLVFIASNGPWGDAPMTPRNWVFFGICGLGLLALLSAALLKLRVRP